MERNPDVSVAVYTEDTGMRLRCKAHSLEVIKPDSQTRLPNPSSEHDKKYKAAVAELNELKNRQPKLELLISRTEEQACKDDLEFVLPALPEKTDFDAAIREYAANSGLEPLPRQKTDPPRGWPRLPALFDLPLRAEDMQSYNRELEQHFKQYREWLQSRDNARLLSAHAIECTIWMENTGSCPADDVELMINFPDTVVGVWDAADEDCLCLQQSKPPAPPKLPTPFSGLGFDRYNDRLLDSLRPVVPFLPVPAPAFNPDELSINEVAGEGTFRLNYALRRLKHHDQHNVATIILLLAVDSIRPFQCQYRLSAANLPRPLTGKLHFRVSRE